MEPDEPGFVLLVKMAVDRVADHLTQFFQRFTLREDGIPERPRRVTAFGSVLDTEDNLLIGHGIRQTQNTPEFASIIAQECFQYVPTSDSRGPALDTALTSLNLLLTVNRGVLSSPFLLLAV